MYVHGDRVVMNNSMMSRIQTSSYLAGFLTALLVLTQAQNSAGYTPCKTGTCWVHVHVQKHVHAHVRHRYVVWGRFCSTYKFTGSTGS